MVYTMWNKTSQFANENEKLAMKTMCFLLSIKLKVGGDSLNSGIFNQTCFFHLRESKYYKHTWKLKASSFTHDDSWYALRRNTGRILANPIHSVGLLPSCTCNFHNKACNLSLHLHLPTFIFSMALFTC